MQEAAAKLYSEFHVVDARAVTKKKRFRPSVCATAVGRHEPYNGGGIYTNSGQMTLTNSTVSRNIAVRKGGGISTNASHISLTNSTVDGNSNLGFGSGFGGVIISESGNVTLSSINLGRVRHAFRFRNRVARIWYSG